MAVDAAMMILDLAIHLVTCIRATFSISVRNNARDMLNLG